jgi:hypothetical protein
MKLYRGLAIGRSEWIAFQEEVLRDGISTHSEKAEMPLFVHDVRDELASWFAMDAKKLADVGPANHGSDPDRLEWRTGSASWRPVICACGDVCGAAFYAHRAAKSRPDHVSVLLTLRAEPEDLWIDSRDFLCTLFQLGDHDRCKRVLPMLFGGGILRYLEKAHSSTDHRYRVAMAHLACQDLDVIEAHHGNGHVIGGRHKTRFCSAFFVALPLAPSAMVSVELLEGHYAAPRIDISLPELIDPNHPSSQTPSDGSLAAELGRS